MSAFQRLLAQIEPHDREFVCAMIGACLMGKKLSHHLSLHGRCSGKSTLCGLIQYLLNGRYVELTCSECVLTPKSTNKNHPEFFSFTSSGESFEHRPLFFGGSTLRLDLILKGYRIRFKRGAKTVSCPPWEAPIILQYQSIWPEFRQVRMRSIPTIIPDFLEQLKLERVRITKRCLNAYSKFVET